MNTTPPYRGRFAPSPSGPLHFGSLVTALASWLHARAHDGTWLVRMEDLDPPREMAGAADDILATLAAFGLESDEAVWFQSTREARYAEALAPLIQSGHVFACACSRKQLEASGLHRGACATPSTPATRALRLRVPELAVGFDDALHGRFEHVLSEAVGDFILRRAEGWFAYQFAVVVDDADQGINWVVRGADLLDSTPRQIWLQRLLHVPTPRYAHIPLVLDEHGRKLSKSLGSLPVDRRDPLPALRAALSRLGIETASGGSVQAQLRLALDAVKLNQPFGFGTSVPSRMVETGG